MVESPHLSVLRCPFPLELDVNAVIGAFCSVAMRSHALAAVLIIPTQADRSEATQVRLNMYTHTSCNDQGSFLFQTHEIAYSISHGNLESRVFMGQLDGIWWQKWKLLGQPTQT